MGACQADSTIRTPGSLAGAGARRVTTVASRPLSARTLKAALRRISQRTLSQDASSGKAGVPLSQDIVQKIVRPHQTQQNVLERAIPEKELRLEPIIVSKEGPVSFAQNGVNETGELTELAGQEGRLVFNLADDSPFQFLSYSRTLQNSSSCP